jgi:hypothetical protein
LQNDTYSRRVRHRTRNYRTEKATVPQQIATGAQSERYTEILHGLNEGNEVAVIASFFVDAEYRLKGFD